LKKYETTFIVDSLIKNEEIEGIITKIEKFITNNGGQIEAIERWGKKRLAYEIKKRQYGYYVHVVYNAPFKLNRLLDREYQLDENIIRYLTVLVDPRLESATVVPVENILEKQAIDNPIDSPIDVTEPLEVLAEPPSESGDTTKAPEDESAPDLVS
jgi:small subunit ribosomal protein S6